MKTDRKRLGDILLALERLERYGAPGALPEEVWAVWTAHQFTAISDLAAGLDESVRSGAGRDVWRSLAGARLLLAQDAFSYDAALLRVSIERDVPRIREAVEAAYSDPALK